MKKEIIKHNCHHFNRCRHCGKELKTGDKIIIIRHDLGIKAYCEICGSRIDDERK
ncbi:MAG: hypothetical protein RSE61_05770 [Anaerovoracaceae bacterium]